jgi:hypothetical protein
VSGEVIMASERASGVSLGVAVVGGRLDAEVVADAGDPEAQPVTRRRQAGRRVRRASCRT